MRSLRVICVWLLSVIVLAGCSLPSGDELLSTPKPSKNYQSLQAELEKILVTQSYAAPLSGENRSTVQLIDLDADGIEEAIAFFRPKTSNSTEVNAYIYRRTDDSYVLAGTVSGSGIGIKSVSYPTISADGKRGMVISWQLISEGMEALTFCDFDANSSPSVLLETEYTSMILTDLTENGTLDLLLLTNSQNNKRIAKLYSYQTDRSLLLMGEAPSLQDAVTIDHIFSGWIKDCPAVFAECRTSSGVGLLTDIFCVADDTLQNLALDNENLSSTGTYRPLSVGAADINNDGVTELPRAVLMAGYTDANSSDAIFMLDWYAYSAQQQPTLIQTTYQNIAEEWFFYIDPSWHDHITATKTSENGLSGVHFKEYISSENQIPLFSIYCATGSLRTFYQNSTDVIPLAQTSKAFFFARISPMIADSSFTADESMIKSRFSLVTKSWY